MVEGQKEWTDSATILEMKNAFAGRQERYHTKETKHGIMGLLWLGATIFAGKKAMDSIYYSGQYLGAREESRKTEKFINDMEEHYNK